LAVRQAEAVYIALSRKNPDLKPDFEINFKSLVADLQSLDGRIKEIVSRRHETLVLFSHPVYEYFEQRYGVNAKSVHWEPDQKPTPEQQSELEKVLNSHPAKWMIWENNPIEEAEKGLDKMGIHSVVYNPCSNSPESGDFMSVMEQNIVILAKAFQ
jgi:zinc transport system substrate-binding protein